MVAITKEGEESFEGERALIAIEEDRQGSLRSISPEKLVEQLNASSDRSVSVTGIWPVSAFSSGGKMAIIATCDKSFELYGVRIDSGEFEPQELLQPLVLGKAEIADGRIRISLLRDDKSFVTFNCRTVFVSDLEE